MAGYTGQLISLDTNTPTEVEANQAQADTAQTQSQLARATMPSDIAIKQQTATGLGLENEQRSIANQSANLSLHQQLQLNALRQHYLEAQQAGTTQADTQSPTQGTAQDGSQLPATGDSGTGAGPAVSQLSSATPLANLFDPRVQQVMQSIDPNDPQAAVKFDAQMKALSSEVPQAGQFVGAYSRANLNNWRSAIGAHGMSNLAATAQTGSASPLAAVATGGGSAAPASPLAPPAAPLGPAGEKYLQGMSILDPKGTGEMLAMQGMMKYQQTGDINDLKRYAPEIYEKVATAQNSLSNAQKTAVTTQFDVLGQQANAVLSLAAKLGNGAPEVRAAYDSGVRFAAGHGWITPDVAQRELSQPIDFAQLAYTATAAQTVTEALKSSGVEAGNEAAARNANPERQSQYIGTDGSGRPIYHDTHAAPGTPDTVGNLPVTAKPSAGAATFQTKQAAYLQVHPGDTQGAIEFANGQRTLPPGEAAIAARAAADREQQTAALTGQPFDTNAAYQAHLAEFQGQGAAPAPGTPTVGGVPGGANPMAHRGWTTPQYQVAKGVAPPVGGGAPLKIDPSKPSGTQANPAVPTTTAQYNALKSGTWYIRPDGWVGTKK